MDSSSKRLCMKTVLGVCILITLLGFLVVGYWCPQGVCVSPKPFPRIRTRMKHVAADSMGEPLSFLSHPLHGGSQFRSRLSFDDMLRDDFEFDMKGSDVMVFLHIQKTGGTVFGRHLVHDLDLQKPCECEKGRKRCKCFRPDSDGKLWLFSRYSTGWKCGLHADWTELTSCVDAAMDRTEKTSAKRRYFYITLLREPVARFLSEFRHVQRGATWKGARHWCGGRPATVHELPPCYTSNDWSDVTLQEFISCGSNLAINRQTRMLADLSLVGCYNRSAFPQEKRDLLLLASAQENLRRMAFFGLCEQQRRSQYVFERTFHLHFLRPFTQIKEMHSSAALGAISPADLARIRRLNYLDVQLYEYAKGLMEKRYNRIRDRDPNFRNAVTVDFDTQLEDDEDRMHTEQTFR